MKTLQLLMIVMIAFSFTSVNSQEMPAKKGEAGTKKYTHRLPNNYGKLGLSNEQRQKIYEIQDAYDIKIDALRQELEDLRNEEILEIQSVLTSNQKTELQKLLEASRKRREAKKATSR